MSDNIKIDNTLPETNGDNNEQLLENPQNDKSEKFKDNNEAATADANIKSTNDDILMANGEHLNNETDVTTISENLNHTTTNDNNQVIINAVANDSLSLLAQYDSQDSSSSSDESSSKGESSDTDSSTKSSSMNSEDSDSPISSIHSEKSLSEIKKKIDEFEDVEDDDDVEGKRNREPIKAIGELGIEDLPPIEDLHISVPEQECNLLGKITSIVDQLVLVESLPNVVPLDLDTILFLDKGQRPLGKVFDVMGQVHCPIYCVRFNTNKEIQEKGIQVGQEVYCAPSAPCTSFVILPELMKQKGSDASWKNDIEPPARFIEYSDDEQERNARRTKKNGKDEPTTTMTEDHIPPRNGHPGNHTYQYHRARRGGQHHGNANRENSHHASHNYPRPNHHHMPVPNHMHHQPQYYCPPPGPSTTVYPNPFAAQQPDPRYYVNPFAYAPTINYPTFNPALFTAPPPPPPQE